MRLQRVAKKSMEGLVLHLLISVAHQRIDALWDSSLYLVNRWRIDAGMKHCPVASVFEVTKARKSAFDVTWH